MKRLPLVFLLALTAGFIYGVLHLFNLRFSAGDIYPKYSSLRADPLGAKVLYESLANLVAARRNYQPLSRVGEGRGRTLFFLGADSASLRFVPEDFTDFETFVADGGRLVIALLPRFQKPPNSRLGLKTPPSQPAGGRKSASSPKRKKIPVGDEEELAELRRISFAARWGLELEYGEVLPKEKGSYPAVIARRQADGPLPETLACHTALYFAKLTNAWHVIYAGDKDRAVVIERELGDGSIVLLADSYPFSNEALRKDRQPELLAWLVGPNREVVFEETHLGVEENPGVATLARQYRLHGLLAALLGLTGLFVWKNSARFLPPYEEEAALERGDLVVGKESAAGFINLLRRNIPAGGVLALCIAEWKKSCARGVSTGKLQQMQALIDAENARLPRDRNPIETYRKLCDVLRRKW